MQNFTFFKFSSTFICLLLLFSSCDSLFEKEYKVELPNSQPLLAVTALISPLDTVRAFVSKTLGISETSAYAPLEGASVIMYKDGIIFDEFTLNDTAKYYLGQRPFQEQKGVFRLEVSAPGFDTIYAIQELPAPVLDIHASLNIKGGPFSSFGGLTDELLVSFTDDPNIKNYYEIIISPFFSYGPTGDDDQFSPETINQNLIKLDGGRFIFSDFGQNGKKIALSFYDFFKSVRTAEIRVYLSSITQDKYLFAQSFQKYNDNEGGLFSEPIIVHSNIENGEGIFTVESVAVDTIRF